MRRGGLVNGHPLPDRAVEGGFLAYVEVWHWRWFSILCNWRNRHKHGWDLIAKHRRGLKEFVLMERFIPKSQVISR